MVCVYGADCKQWRELKKRQWFGMFCGAILYSALAQGLTYVALQQTTANNVTIISRIEPALIMLFAMIFLNEPVPKRSLAGAGVALLGVLTVFLWPLFEGESLVFGGGETCTVISAFAVASSSTVSKKLLKDVPLGIFMIFRNAVGIPLFILLGYITNGETITAPFSCGWDVGKWVLLFAALVLTSQIMWFMALKTASGQQISFAVSFGFVISLLCAYLILDEVPTTAQSVGVAIIASSLFGVALSTVLYPPSKGGTDISNTSDGLDPVVAMVVMDEAEQTEAGPADPHGFFLMQCDSSDLAWSERWHQDDDAHPPTYEFTIGMGSGSRVF